MEVFSWKEELSYLIHLYRYLFAIFHGPFLHMYQYSRVMDSGSPLVQLLTALIHIAMHSIPLPHKCVLGCNESVLLIPSCLLECVAHKSLLNGHMPIA